MSTEEHETPKAAAVSGAVEKARTKAEEYIRDPEKSKKLLDEALKKAKKKEKNKGPLADLWNNLTALFRLLQAYIHREYVDIPWASLVMVVVAIIYFVSPIDLIPDFIPVAGYIDDAAVIVFVLAQIKADLDNFLQWEAEHKKD
jgi:uncharacterized membrane protein YkvA (DUF1232 family)